MTRTSSFVSRIIGAALAAILFIAIVALVLTAISPFQLINPSWVPSIDLTQIPVNDYSLAGTNVALLIWSYRGIDVMMQALLLMAAAIGAAALFRIERGKEEEKEE
jgi:multisubunit Na+/H+ antiporter MnhB subunit